MVVRNFVELGISEHALLRFHSPEDLICSEALVVVVAAHHLYWTVVAVVVVAQLEIPEMAFPLRWRPTVLQPLVAYHHCSVVAVVALADSSVVDRLHLHFGRCAPIVWPSADS